LKRQYSLTFSEFARMISQSPTLRARLLRQRGFSNSEAAEIAPRLCDFYRLLREDELSTPESCALVSKARKVDLLQASGLPQEVVTLPVDLYRDYCAVVRSAYEAGDRYRPTDEEVEFRLTSGGCNRLDYWFSLPDEYGANICCWAANTGGWGSIVFEIEEVAEACAAFLAARGMVFSSPVEVVKHALRAGWPHAEDAAGRILPASGIGPTDSC
jgi:hypothetical protein